MAIRTDHPVYVRVKRKVVLRQLPAGEAINVRALQEEMSTSQVPVREALIGLAAEDLVEFVHGRGFFSKSYSLAEIMGDADLLAFLLLDAAHYISSAHTLKTTLATMVGQVDLKSRDLDLYAYTRNIADIFANCYRPPHRDLISNSLFRIAYIIHVDTMLNGNDITKNIEDYFHAILSKDLALIDQAQRTFWDGLKIRLPETLLLADSIGPLR